MKSTNFDLVKYEADEGKVFDWKEARFEQNEEGEEIQVHLNAKVLYIGKHDAITNYVEVDADGVVSELAEPEFASQNDYEAALAELGVV